MITPVTFQHLPSIYDVLKCQETLFVIPTFQRPYAWGEKQINDLKNDFEQASKDPKKQHYFSHIHVVPIKENDNSIGRFLDENNNDVKLLIDNISDIPQVYSVIDGQQRLVTLYLLSIMKELLSSNSIYIRYPDSFKVPLSNGSWLPRIIINPDGDHRFFRNIIEYLLKLTPSAGSSLINTIKSHIASLPVGVNCAAQKRLKVIALLLIDCFFESTVDPKIIEIIDNRNIKIGVTELNEDYALSSFITLNDRGKSLTILEKLKSYWVKTAITAIKTDTATGVTVLNTTIDSIHTVFGNLYKDADLCVETKLRKNMDDSESLITQLLYHWLDMENIGHEIGWGAENIYTWLMKVSSSLSKPDLEIALNSWIEAAQQLHEQLEHLCKNYLLSTSPATTKPSFHFPATSTLHYDYYALLISLPIPPHLLTVFLKYRHLFGNKYEWHERFDLTLAINAKLIEPIREILKNKNEQQDLKSYINDIENKLPKYEESQKDRVVEKSLLEAIERAVILGWMQGTRSPGGFVSLCDTIFKHNSTPNDFISKWYMFCNSSGKYDEWYIHSLCNRSAPSTQYYLLYERERELTELMGSPARYGNVYELSTEIELEHILPKELEASLIAAGHTFSRWGFKDATDFKESVLEMIGNKMLLWKQCNISVGNDLPDIKATHYNAVPCSHPRCANDLIQVAKVGKELSCLGGTPSILFRDYFELRCAEIAAFALKRLF